MKSYFLFGLFFRNSQGGVPKGMLDLIASLISLDHWPEWREAPNLWGALHPPLPTWAPLLALASGGPVSHTPHSHHCQNPSTSSKTNPKVSYSISSSLSSLYLPSFTPLPPKFGFVHWFISAAQEQYAANSRYSTDLWWMHEFGKKGYTEICTGCYFKKMKLHEGTQWPSG